MYAIVSIAGQQFKVEKGKKVFVHRLPGAVGEEVSFNQVLLISQDEVTTVGAPYLPDAFVLAQIISHNRGDKVLVFKKKRRKGYQKLNGHRQDFTQIQIDDISATGASEKKTTPRKKEVPAKVKTEEPAKAKAPAKKQAARVATEEKPKKAPVKKTKEVAAKKPVTKDSAKEASVKKTGKKTK